MRKTLRFIIAALVVTIAVGINAFAQETTGNIEVTIKDATGAVVPNVPVTVTNTGGTAGFKRTATTNDSGFVRVLLVPPGTYNITSGAISGFAQKIVGPLSVSLGSTSSITIDVVIAEVGADVTIQAGDVNPIDVTDAKIQTTISSQLAELLPKGQNFSTVLKFTAATRPEPRSGQFQIDGASGAENTFIIDGQEVTSTMNGKLDANSNLPFSMVQEVQVKNSGFEAEYGGATGGVINIVTKGGSNELHGEFGVNLRSSRAEPIAYPGLRINGTEVERYPSRRNQYNETNPTAAVGGPIWKDRVWFRAVYAPQRFTQSRTLTYLDPITRVPTGAVETYRSYRRDEKAFLRLDGQPHSRVNVFGTFNWNPIGLKGTIPSFASELSPVPTTGGTNPVSGGAYLNNRGGRQNSVSYALNGSYAITDNLIVTARNSYYFQNAKAGSYGLGDISLPRVSCANAPQSPQQFPAGFGCVRGGSNGISSIANVAYDITTRDQIDADVTYIFNAGGRHMLKGGYQQNGISNKVILGTNDLISLRWGTTGAASIASISGTPGLVGTPGATGVGVISTFLTRGDVASDNIGIYVQDKWQPFNRLTLDLGIRTEQEDVPSYAPGLPGMKFSFSSKMAPRIGGAFDLTGDGKTKVSAFYGWFYDRFKLSLPRGSFGGDEYHNLYFELFASDTLATINRDVIFAGGQPIPGGSCQPTATMPIFGRVRCDKDLRVSSNLPGEISEVGGIDPNIKPFRQNELTFGFQRQIGRLYVFSARYTRKQVDTAIEDAGIPNAEGNELYIIGNPGKGLIKEFSESIGLIAPLAERKYDALELKFERAFANNYFFSANYTYSRLRGNYSGLASSDEEGGRSDVNVNRYFDLPIAGFAAGGGADNGPLATDRPHVLKAFGSYNLNWSKFKLWKNNSTDFNVFTTATSGSVITSFVNINNISQMILTKRGDQGRTPFFTQTDFAIRHNITFGKDGRYRLIADADIVNVFNQGILTNRGLNPSGQGGNIINTQEFSVLDPEFGLITPAEQTACNNANNQAPCLFAAYRAFQANGSPELVARAQAAEGRNIFYNYPSSYQGRRTIRYGLRFIF